MDTSPLIMKAKAILGSVRGKKLSVEENKDAAIELAGLMLEESRRHQTRQEKKLQAQLSRMMNDGAGKVFTTSVTDQCFRSQNPNRVADQMVYLLNKYNVPRFLDAAKKFQLMTFKFVGKAFASVLVPLAKRMLRKETSAVILPGEPEKLSKHMKQRRSEGVRINLNHLGEAILGEEEAKRRLEVYLNDLANPEVEYISVKISTICSQINLLGWNETLNILTDRLKKLYRAAKENKYFLPDGSSVPKFVNLDMEEYRDLHLTVELFRKVLDDAEFYDFSAGIVLQSYLPDSYLIQQELTVWAMRRIAAGGAPIKIRIVKGANLAMEQVEASLRGWVQAPYPTKEAVDANFKRMVAYGCIPEHAKAAYLGIGSHNLFDVAYTMLLRAENKVEPYVCFEMLEGMADHIRRIVQSLTGDMLLYCPAATKAEFQNAVAYLVRRLDENTAPQNFLRHAFGMIPGTKEWQGQVNLFSQACQAAKETAYLPRRLQNRFTAPQKEEICSQFQNEADTDWSLPQNVRWAEAIIKDWSQKKFDPIPLVIGLKEINPDEKVGIGDSPTNPGKELYRYTLADPTHVELAIQTALEAQKAWEAKSVRERTSLIAEAAHGLKKHRNDLIGVMIADTGKTVAEADVEISEAIDFGEYYRRNVEEIGFLEDVRWRPKGPVLVAPPWNFPCSIPAGGILAALAAGNVVIFKPASEAILVGWELANIFWNAGIPKDVLQFIACEDDPVGSQLVKDPRIKVIVLTGATSTAKLFLKMRPGLDLIAETGGKNPLIVTNMSDRDLAIKDLVHSAFGHAGQKCSACSLAICEAEVYDDQHFLEHLRDAAASLTVGNPWNLSTRLNPLIHAPNSTLLRGLTTLDEGEEWLLKPKQDPKNPNLWSPGIKIGVKPGSFMHQNELFGPVLGIMRAENLKHAIELANGTPYGLTSGLHSLDEREQAEWLKAIEAGNLYINRGITGAIVQRQPFGGCKESSFGRGIKAGGPNYILQFLEGEQISLPKEKEALASNLQTFLQQIPRGCISKEENEVLQTSLGNYAFFWTHYFSKEHDPSQLLGQDNILSYAPYKDMSLRVQKEDKLLDILRIMGAALTVSADLQISIDGDHPQAGSLQDLAKGNPNLKLIKEQEKDFITRLNERKANRVRLISPPSEVLKQALADAASNMILGPVYANGRLELLNHLREVSLSKDYHRYGNLGDREGEKRSPLPEYACGPQCYCG